MSKLLSLIIVGIIVVTDIYLIAIGNESFSNVIYMTAKDWPILAVVFGIVIGHLFWPNKPRCDECLRKI